MTFQLNRKKTMTTKQMTPLAAGSRKAALATGSLSALSLLSFGAQAGEIHVTGSPVSMSLGSADGASADWDVDGTGGVDFHLWHAGVSGISSAAILLGNGGGLNGSGMVVTSSTLAGSQMQPLAASFQVGPTLAAGFGWGYASNYMTVLFRSSGNNSPGNQLHGGVNHIGFSFLNGADLFYGFANLDLNLSAGVATITDWTYNDTPGGSVHVVDSTSVPEPSTLSLALIGLGAGGVRAWRRRKQAQALAA
jgi:hypothetical protein